MSTTHAEANKLDVTLDFAPRVNFAFQQNAIPVVRRIEIRNQGPSDLQNVRLRLTSTPDWAEDYEHRIDLIPAGADHVLMDLSLELKLNFLAGLTERIRGELKVELFAGDPDAKESLVEKTLPAEIYAYNQWTGCVTLPEILAAFVTPNVAVVERVLARAATLLGTRTGSSALDAYQTKNRRRVFEILSAIFQAVREQKIHYSSPPASFEQGGQRVRFPGQIMDAKLATCLDLCLFFASLIEQSGLRPLILIHKGHSYMGCWLTDDSLTEPATDELQGLRKRVELDELLVFESTVVCHGANADFSAAVAAAKLHLAKDEIFYYAIDLYRARISGMRPLPLQQETAVPDLTAAADPAPTPGPSVESGTTEAPEFTTDIEVDETSSTPGGRVEQWKQQLLDLTLRNRLLNFRETKQTIPIACPEPDRLEDELAADKTFKICEQSQMMEGSDPRSLELWKTKAAHDPLRRYLIEEMASKRLRSPLPEAELSRRLVDLYRRARNELEESGANTLYLALGFLEWKETAQSDRAHRAPVLLIPVQLERRSVQQGFVLKRYDEEALINVSLLEMLKRDFEMEIAGVNPPPEGESGVDVPRVFRLFQQAVREIPGWELRRDVWLGQFSFAKFLLWKDLHDRVDVLSQNSVVDHLIHRPGQPFTDDVETLREDELDQRLPCREIFCPASTDSSQLAAVAAAANGKNFVLHGPPGTGKSQTITNLIAHGLAVGKRVLFVAEKRAALEVVHRRLEQIGLGPFCLELHSNKSGKAEVLRQFGAALDFAAQREPEEWERLAGQLEQSRAELNQYVEELHRRHPNGLSAYTSYSWLIAHRESVDLPALRMEDIEDHSREHFEQLQKLCDDLQIRGGENRLGAEAKSALKDVRATDWTPDWEDQVAAAANEVLESLTSFESSLKSIMETPGIAPAHASRDEYDVLARLARCLIGIPVLPGAFAESGEWDAFAQHAANLVAAGRRRDDARRALEGFDINLLQQLDIASLRTAHHRLVHEPGFLNGLRIWFLLRPVRAARQKGAPKWDRREAEQVFASMETWTEARKILENAGDVPTRLGAVWKEGEADWDAVESVLERGSELHELIGRLAGTNVDRLLELRQRVGRLLPVASEFLAKGKPVAESLEMCAAAWEDVLTRLAKLDVLLKTPWAESGAAHVIDHWKISIAEVLRHRSDLQNWCRWQQSRQAAAADGLEPLLEAVDQERISLEQLRQRFERAYREAFLRRLITLSATLRDFWGEEQQARIQNFHRLDDEYTRLTAEAVAARLATGLPGARQANSPPASELGILQRERSKRARHKPVRRLLSEISTIAPRLKPCFLMSPLSVAQYLDAAQDNFDVVVFDEASQIPVWDAVGAIARGRQVVVVGDPKQLPPTNFFGRVESDEEAIDDGVITDLESILDECLGSGLEVRYLRWHYRSRREGLIAFSNHHYYENQLHTFPAPESGHPGVRLVPVEDGYYDKGKSRTNPAEAEAVVEEVVRRLSDPQEAGRSIGIVTFSQAQQTLVMDKLDEARRVHPEIEGAFNDESEEPLFVKNLENVQGDERDVILFSVCYGPDQTGRVSMNFGPLNRSGGERRLNVAVTRARQEVVVFSTLRADQIDLSRTRARGAEHLKAYLEYAERGPRALAAAVQSASPEDYESLFEEEVARFLKSQGFDTHAQVGCSGYRIDLAVVAPGHAGRYILGIECDGASYHRAATARDRDRLRQGVLEGLGWRIHRIWSTDWWRDFDKASQRLLEVVRHAIEDHESDVSSQPSSQNDANPDAGTKDSGPVKSEVVENVERPPEPKLAAFTANSDRELEYRPIRVVMDGDQDAFYEPYAREYIRQQIAQIVAGEGPICESLLTRRVTEGWRFSRAGAKIREILRACTPEDLPRTTQGEETFYWPAGLSPSDYRYYRVPSSDDEGKRKIEEIPVEELCNAHLDVVEHYLSLPEEDLFREVAKKFGFGRVSGNISETFAEALQRLTAAGLVNNEEGSVKSVE